MSLPSKSKPTKSGNELLRYAGLAGQLFFALGIAVFAGYKIDGWLQTSFPVLVWVLPFVVLSMIIYKLIKETSKQKKKDAAS